MRRDAQGRLVVLPRRRDVVAEHEGVGESGMKIGNTIDRHADRRRGRTREPDLKHGDRVPDLATPVVLATRAQHVGNIRRAGGRRCESDRG